MFGREKLTNKNPPLKVDFYVAEGARLELACLLGACFQDRWNTIIRPFLLFSVEQNLLTSFSLSNVPRNDSSDK